MTDNIAVGVLASVPPYPYDIPTDHLADDLPVFWHNLDELAHRHLQWQSGTGGLLFYATAWGKPSDGDNIASEARLRACHTLSRINIPQIQYRTDISTLFHKLIESMVEYGLIDNGKKYADKELFEQKTGIVEKRLDRQP